MKPDDFWEKQRRADAKIPPMPRSEYLLKYPNGGPTSWSGKPDSDSYREFMAAIKRRDREGRRGSWIRFWWAMAGLAVVFGIVTITQGVWQAIFMVLVLVICYCIVEMGMNLPSR